MGMIIAIIVALAVGGGAVYYATKTATPSSQNTAENDYQSQADQNSTANNNQPAPQTPPPSNAKVGGLCTPTSSPSITVISPNGGELWKIGQTYAVNWSTCNAPANSWVRLSYSIPSGTGNIHYTQDCFGGGQIPASQGNYSWKISSSVFGCSDGGYIFPPNTSFQTKVKAELYTGTQMCDGYPPQNAPCLTGTRTLEAQDESDNNFTISNLPQ